MFFRAHQTGLAFAIVLTLLAAVIAFILAVWRSDARSGKLFLPYAAWVAFAATLNGAILAMNAG